MKRFAALALTVLLSGLTGCRTLGMDEPAGGAMGFLEDRARDTLDIIPVSFSTGLGLYGGVRATEFFGTGVGYAETERLGWVRRRQVEGEPLESALGGYLEWPEKVWGAGLVWERTDDPPPGAGNWGFFVPIRNLPNPRYTLYPGSVLDFEADVHVGLIGLRATFSPVQIADWFTGWANYDLLDDDLNRIQAEQ